MNLKKLLLSSTGLAIVGVMGLVAAHSSALAYRGDYSQPGPNYTAERHEAMEKAFTDLDYQAWKALRQNRGRVSQIINAENFPEFAQARQLAKEGKTSEANAIRQKLGLRTNNGKPLGRGFGRHLRFSQTGQ